MVKNFFDLVKDGFFNPLSNKNKRYNYDLLQLINEKMSLDNLQVTKDEIADWIVEYYENMPTELIDDETSETEADVRSFAYEKIRYFVKCGWLIEDFEGLKITYQLDENSIKVLLAMKNAVEEDEKPLEFSGYVFNIYSNLCNHFDFDHSVDVVEQTYSASIELNSMLRGLNVNIKKFLTDLISNNKTTPKEILRTIFIEYQKKVVLKAFKNFREKDNPSKYKLKIESKIDYLLEKKKFSMMVDNYIQVKKDGVKNDETIAEATSFLSERLDYIRYQFETIEETISILDRRNTKYVQTAESRLNFLLNEETDIEGRIIESLKEITKTDDKFYDDIYFDIFTGTNIDENSLYNQINKKQKPKTEPLLINVDYDVDEANKMVDKLFTDNKYSVFEINKYVLSLLEGKNQIHAKDVKINEFNDILKLFLIELYSENNSIDYKIIFKEDSYTALGYRMNDFIIERKKRQWR